MGLLLQFYLSGLALGTTICGLHCSILLVPLAARGGGGWREGLRIGLFFGAGKTFAFGVVGLAASHYGLLVREVAGKAAFPAAGAVLILLGAWFAIHRGKCSKSFRTGPPLLLGLIDGISPCPPALGFAVYLAHLGQGALFGAAAGMLFAFGTLTGPILGICGLTPYLWRKLSRFSKAGIVLRAAGAAVFFLWGAALIAG